MNIACAICLEPFRSADTLHGTMCGHVFHRTCLDDWLRLSHMCPSCRQPVEKSIRTFLEFLSDASDASSPLRVQSRENYQALISRQQATINKLESEVANKNREINLLRKEHRAATAKSAENKIKESLEKHLLKKDAMIAAQVVTMKSLQAQLSLQQATINKLELELANKNRELRREQHRAATAKPAENRCNVPAVKTKKGTEAPRTPLGSIDQNTKKVEHPYNLRRRV